MQFLSVIYIIILHSFSYLAFGVGQCFTSAGQFVHILAQQKASQYDARYEIAPPQIEEAKVVPIRRDPRTLN